MAQDFTARQQNALLDIRTDSFAQFLRRVAPELLPAREIDTSVPELTRHGRTVVAVRCTGGVVVAADRHSAMGRTVRQLDVDRILGTDDRTIIGIAGAAGSADELVRLFQVEVDHFEKIHGQRLSMDGRAARLSSLARTCTPMMAQGLAVTPLLAGWDDAAHRGRIFTYDATGGRGEEQHHSCVGIGAIFALDVLESGFRVGMDARQAAILAIRALSAAVSEESAEFGPDLARGVNPAVAVADARGVTRWPGEEVAVLTKQVVDDITAADRSRKA